jgi:hypothetical protein
MNAVIGAHTLEQAANGAISDLMVEISRRKPIVSPNLALCPAHNVQLASRCNILQLHVIFLTSHSN